MFQSHYLFCLDFSVLTASSPKIEFYTQIPIKIQSNSVITNCPGLAIFVRYNQVNLCTKVTIGLENPFVITECSLTTEFVITEFQCITEFFARSKLLYWLPTIFIPFILECLYCVSVLSYTFFYYTYFYHTVSTLSWFLNFLHIFKHTFVYFLSFRNTF